MANGEQGEQGRTGEGSLGYPIDRKYRFLARCVEHAPSHAHNEHDAVLFAAHDAALPYALQAYRRESIRLGAAVLQIAAIDRLIEDVRLWQAQQPGRVRVADVDDPEILRQPEAPAAPAAPVAPDAVRFRL